MDVWHGEKEREVFELYCESLDRLTFNSKPVISNLTELADEYRREYAPLIVRIIEDRIRKVPPELKLTHLYLLDSIAKNHRRPYAELFQQNIVSVFRNAFLAAANVKWRGALHKLRETWGRPMKEGQPTTFSIAKLNQLDHKVAEIDPQWPIQQLPTASDPPPPPVRTVIVNPNIVSVNNDFLRRNSQQASPVAPEEVEIAKLKRELAELKKENEKVRRKKEEDEQREAEEKARKEKEEKERRIQQQKLAILQEMENEKRKLAEATAKDAKEKETKSKVDSSSGQKGPSSSASTASATTSGGGKVCKQEVPSFFVKSITTTTSQSFMSHLLTTVSACM